MSKVRLIGWNLNSHYRKIKTIIMKRLRLLNLKTWSKKVTVTCGSQGSKESYLEGKIQRLFCTRGVGKPPAELWGARLRWRRVPSWARRRAVGAAAGAGAGGRCNRATPAPAAASRNGVDVGSPGLWSWPWEDSRHSLLTFFLFYIFPFQRHSNSHRDFTVSRK